MVGDELYERDDVDKLLTGLHVPWVFEGDDRPTRTWTARRASARALPTTPRSWSTWPTSAAHPHESSSRARVPSRSGRVPVSGQAAFAWVRRR